jgi:hypothetical protein
MNDSRHEDLTARAKAQVALLDPDEREEEPYEDREEPYSNAELHAPSAQ